MDGTILNVDPSGGGLIRGSDGARYDFAAAEWKAAEPAVAGQNVDFEIEGGAARTVYPVAAPAAPPAPAAAPVPSAQAPRLGPFFADRPGLPFAAVILIACLFPFVSLGLVSPNLFDLVGITSMIGSFGRVDGSAQFGLTLFYLLYLVPILAIVAIVQELRRRGGMGVRVGVGLFCLVAPFAILIAAQHLIQSTLPGGGREQLNFVSQISFGWILIALASLGLIAAGLGWSPFGPGSEDLDDVF